MALKKLLDEKAELIERIETQMQPDLKAGRITPQALEALRNAKINLAGARQHMSGTSEKAEYDALYLFGRLNWNLGEFMVLKPDKPQS